MRPDDVKRKTTNQTLSGPPPLGPNPSWIKNKFADPEWAYVDVYGREYEIDFDAIPRGYRYACKLYLWALEYCTDRRVQRTPIKAAHTFLTNFYLFKTFTEACVERNIAKLADVEECDLDEIVAASLKTSTKKAHLERWQVFCQRLFWLGPDGVGMVPDGLSFLIEDGYKPSDAQLFPKGITATMPDAIAEALLLCSLEFLRHAPAILTCIEQEQAFRATLTGARKKLHAPQMILRRRSFLRANGMLSSVEESIASLKNLLHLTKFEQDADLKRAEPVPHDMLSFISPKYMNVLLRHLIAACYCTVAGFTGFRSSEVLSMCDGDVFSRGSRIIIRTKLSKTIKEKGGAWIERTAPPAVLDAFQIMEKLTKLCARKNKRVWVTMSGNLLVPQTISFKVRDFLAFVADRPDWHFNTHQLRRYFALFYVRRFKGSIDALRRNFRHVTFASIEAYIRDPNGARYLAEANSTVAQEIVTDLVFGLGEYASRSALRAHRVLADYRASNLPLEEIEREMRHKIANDYRHVRATYWGYCLLQPNETEGAICGGKRGKPDVIEMHPANCGRCNLLAVGKDQLDYWTSARRVHQDVIESSVSLPLFKAASSTFVRQADEIIGRLAESNADRL